MHKLSAGRPRAELIAAYAYASPAAAPQPSTPDAPADAPADGRPYEPAPYHADADETVQCPNCQRLNDDDASFCDQCGFELKGSDDVIVKQPATEQPAVTAAAPAPKGQAAHPDANPVDAEGNIDADAVCANPDCQHLASSHLDDEQAGRNTGACEMTDCSCLAMQVESQPNSGGDDQGPQGSSGQGAQPGPQSEELAHAPAGTVADAPAPLGAPAAGGSDLNPPPPVQGGQNMGSAFTIPVAVIEGQPTGDGRQIAPDALTWRNPPLPLMGLATETHDPEGLDMNAPAVICGRIDSFERSPGEGATQIIAAKGFYLANDDGQYFADLTEQMGRCGISADIAAEASEVQVGEVDLDGWPSEMSTILTQGTIMGLTQVPYPAFEGAYIVLGDGAEQPAAQAIPQQVEGPQAPASPPAAVTAGAQLLHLMSYESCEPCQLGEEVILASGAGPMRPPASWFEDPAFALGDGRLQEILDRRGQRTSSGKYACPLTITDEGRVFGHLAPWGVCHIGMPGCVTAPRSASGYAYFKRGQHIVSAEGEKIRVGTVTANVGHADVRKRPADALAHYDNVATACADVNVGEDEYGIWLAGAIRPSASEQQVRALRASSISGDWRGLGGHLELVAALAVPVPGYPHAVVAAGEQETLLAAGTSVMHRLKHPAEPEPPAEQGDVALRHALAPLLETARSDARERLSALR